MAGPRALTLTQNRMVVGHAMPKNGMNIYTVNVAEGIEWGTARSVELLHSIMQRDFN